MTPVTAATLAARNRYTVTATGGPAVVRDLARNRLRIYSRSFTTGSLELRHEQRRTTAALQCRRRLRISVIPIPA
jgi:hypothetical protein